MVPYYFLMGITACFGFLSLRILIRNIEQEYQLLHDDHTADVFFSIWIVMLCCRSKYCGCDLPTYEYYFSCILGTPFSIKNAIYLNGALGGLDVGFILYNMLVQLVTKSYQVYLAVTAMVCVIPLWRFYKRESENQFLSVMVFITFGLFSMYFSGLRQVLAMTLVIPAYYACKERKPLRFIGIVLLAMCTHKSAYVMGAIYPVYHMRIKKKHLWIIVPLLMLCYALNDRIFLFLLRWSGYDASVTTTGAFGILVLLALFAIYAYVIPADALQTGEDEDNMDLRDFIGLRNLLLLSVFLQMFAPLHTLAMRINYYFLLLVPVTVTKVAPRASIQYNQIGKLAVIVISLFLLVRYLFQAGPGDILHIYPYSAFWELVI